MEYLLHIFIFIGIYTVLAVSLDLLVGHTGLMSVAHAAFYGIGAYASALLASNPSFPFPLDVLTGMIVAAFLSLLISMSSLRLYEDYFIIATFGFQMIFLAGVNNLLDLTQGPMGIRGIPRPSIFGWVIRYHFEFAALSLVWVVLAYMIVGLTCRSPFGRVLNAIREDEVFAQSLGKNPFRFKLLAFALSGCIAASAGSLYARYISYIDPTSFTITDSILVLSMIIIGGTGSLWGPLIGATLLVTLPEILRFIGINNSAAANLRQIFYGSLLIAIMLFRPRGITGKFSIGR